MMQKHCHLWEVVNSLSVLQVKLLKAVTLFYIFAIIYKASTEAKIINKLLDLHHLH